MDKYGQHPSNYIRTMIVQSAAHDTPYTQDITEHEDALMQNCRVVIEMEGDLCRVVEVTDLRKQEPLTDHREEVQAALEEEAEGEGEEEAQPKGRRPKAEQLPAEPEAKPTEEEAKPTSPTTPTPAGSKS